MIQRSQKENILTITWFLVKPNERKKEIGKELLQYVVQFAKASNISKIWVEPIPFAEQEMTVSFHWDLYMQFMSI